MFLKTIDEDYVNLDHVCRIYVERMECRLDSEWNYDPKAKLKGVCCVPMAVTTENIRSDCFQPICLGYFKTLLDVEFWVEDDFDNFNDRLHFGSIFPCDVEVTDEKIDQIFYNAEYSKINTVTKVRKQ